MSPVWTDSPGASACSQFALRPYSHTLVYYAHSQEQHLTSQTLLYLQLQTRKKDKNKRHVTDPDSLSLSLSFLSFTYVLTYQSLSCLVSVFVPTATDSVLV